MATQPVEKESRPPAPTSHALTWYAFGTLAAVAAGILAAILNLAGYSPVGLLPVGIGIALGATLTGLAAATGVTCGKRLVVGAVVLAVVAVVAEHAWLYRDFRRQWHESRANSTQLAMFRPETPWSPREYFAHEATPETVAYWCLDAALVTAATIGAVAVGRRLLK